MKYDVRNVVSGAHCIKNIMQEVYGEARTC